MKSASASNAPFFPTGRASFIYIGELEASKRRKHKHEIFKSLLETQQKNTTLKHQCQVVFEFLAKQPLHGDEFPLGTVQLLWLENKVLLFHRLWMRREGKDCVIVEEHLETFSLSFVSKQENKVLKKPKEKGSLRQFFFPS
jgi:hypothetical protein